MSQASSGPLGRAPAASESGEAKPDTDPALTDVLDCLLRFGTAMMRAGDTAFRVREWTGAIARAMGVEALSVRLALGGITASARRGSEHATLTHEIAPPGIDAWRLGALENLARDVRPGLMPADLAAKLAAIEAQPPLYSLWQTAAAVGAASGAFSYLNGGGALEVFAAVAGGGIGQLLRSLLLRRRLNQYAVTALCAVIASGVYCAIAAAAMRAGFGTLRDAAGFISSVLFLVPGFPFVAALLDLLQHQGLASITRLAYGTMLLLAAAFGLTIVAATAGLNATPAPPLPLGEPLTLLLRAIASFCGGCGFAILYNSSSRTVLAVGVLALVRQRAAPGAQRRRHDAGAGHLSRRVRRRAIGLVGAAAPARAAHRAYGPRHHHHDTGHVRVPNGRAFRSGRHACRNAGRCIGRLRRGSNGAGARSGTLRQRPRLGVRNVK